MTNFVVKQHKSVLQEVLANFEITCVDKTSGERSVVECFVEKQTLPFMA